MYIYIYYNRRQYVVFGDVSFGKVGKDGRWRPFSTRTRWRCYWRRSMQTVHHPPRAHARPAAAHVRRARPCAGRACPFAYSARMSIFFCRAPMYI